MDIRNQFRRPYRTDKPFLDIPRHWRTWLISDVPPGQRDNPTRRPMTDGSREATLGFSREATSEISQARECLERVPPHFNSSRRDDGERHQTSPQIFIIRNQFRRPYRTDKPFLDIPRHWRTWLISDVPPGQRDNGTTQHVAP